MREIYTRMSVPGCQLLGVMLASLIFFLFCVCVGGWGVEVEVVE